MPQQASRLIYSRDKPLLTDLAVTLEFHALACIQCKLCTMATRNGSQVVYEAYGAGGTGFVMECLTDNVN